MQEEGIEKVLKKSLPFGYRLTSNSNPPFCYYFYIYKTLNLRRAKKISMRVSLFNIGTNYIDVFDKNLFEYGKQIKEKLSEATGKKIDINLITEPIYKFRNLYVQQKDLEKILKEVKNKKIKKIERAILLPYALLYYSLYTIKKIIKSRAKT